MRKRVSLHGNDARTARKGRARRKCLSTASLMLVIVIVVLIVAQSMLLDVSNDDENALFNLQNSGKLRLDWSNVPLTSPMAKRIYTHMHNCSLPLGTFRPRNRMGLGSDLHVWSQVLCNGMDEGVRVWSLLPWQWRDKEACSNESAVSSALSCYFDSAEGQCESDASIVSTNVTTLHEISSPYNSKCPSILGDTPTTEDIGSFRAAAMEYLFSHVGDTVIQEAQRQLNLVFPQGRVPPNLITVQIRWGDKKKEMKLLPASDYVKGVQEILNQRLASENDDVVHIYLATEDPKAVEAFQQAAPNDWNIYVDHYFREMLPYRQEQDVYNQGPKTARVTKGRAGLVALGSLLVAMEANDFVLTTASNWSRLMNELRKNVINPTCNDCTNTVDLKFGEW